MSAGVCGKRLGFEEIFASPAPKRARCCSPYGHPAVAADDLALLLRMFPSMDRQVVESVVNANDQNIDEAIRSLHALCLSNGSAVNELAALGSVPSSNGIAVEGDASAPQAEQNIEVVQNGNLDFGCSMPQDRSNWVGLFVHEMRNASDWDDVRGGARRFLEAFEKSVFARSTASNKEEMHENVSLKEKVQCLLRDNQILKRAVAIQHERHLENEEKLKEVQQLKHIISQCQEQVRTLELNNYTLKIHLQRAQDGNSNPSHFHPDVF